MAKRLWIDGCFDLFHFGHANAIRQAHAFGEVVVAGVHSDAEIELHKGPPVLSLAERTELVEACRWTDEVVPDAPYVTEVEFVQSKGIDLVIHGDDVTTDAEGRDTYRLVKQAGMYRECKRTEGISTTDAIARVLTGASSEPHAPLSEEQFRRLLIDFATDKAHLHPILECLTEGDDVRKKRRRIEEYAEGDSLVVSHPEKLENCAIVSGPFDGFSVDDLRILEAWSKDQPLAVALWSDEEVLEKTGKPPIFSVQERALSVLQCRHVSALIVPSTNGLKSSYTLPAWPSSLYQRIESRREALEARQARKLQKRVVEKTLEDGRQ